VPSRCCAAPNDRVWSRARFSRTGRGVDPLAVPAPERRAEREASRVIGPEARRYLESLSRCRPEVEFPGFGREILPEAVMRYVGA